MSVADDLIQMYFTSVGCTAPTGRTRHAPGCVGLGTAMGGTPGGGVCRPVLLEAARTAAGALAAEVGAVNEVHTVRVCSVVYPQ